mgnify:CR=1 FL=1
MSASLAKGSIIGAKRSWSGSRDAEGYRTYVAAFLIKVTDPRLDGPATVLQTPGLPLPGTPWIIGNDVDVWAWCRGNMTVKPLADYKDEPSGYWLAEIEFSTRPPERDKNKDGGEASSCLNAQIDDPLLEPPKISINTVKKTEEAVYANKMVYKDGTGATIRTKTTTGTLYPRILNSSHEQVRGPQVEFDRGYMTVRIEQNVASFYQAFTLPNQMRNSVNDATLWGMAARRIRLVSTSATRQYHGLCNLYYTRTLEFEADDNGFDRDILDEGARVLNGYWDTNTASPTYGEYITIPDPLPAGGELDPSNFVQYKDPNGENGRVILNGRGMPVASQGNPTEEPGRTLVQEYGESNFLTLGIPTVL